MIETLQKFSVEVLASLVTILILLVGWVLRKYSKEILQWQKTIDRKISLLNIDHKSSDYALEKILGNGDNSYSEYRDNKKNQLLTDYNFKNKK